MYRLLVSQADVPVSWPSRQQITVKVRAWGGLQQASGQTVFSEAGSFPGRLAGVQAA